MPKLIFASQSSKDSSNASANTERLINYYPERMGDGGRTQLTLRQAPGLTAFGTTDSLLLRDIKTIDGTVYVAAQGNLISVNSAGVPTVLGAIDDDEETIIDGNGSNVTIAANGKYYLWDGVSITQPAGGILTNIGSVAFNEFYTILTEQSGNRFEYTGLADPATRSGLNFRTCESNNDNVVRAMTHQGYAYLFNERSTEVWTTSGAANENAYIQVAGGRASIGLKSKKLCTHMDRGLFVVGHDDVVYLFSGGAAQPISTPAVETSIISNDATHCYYYEHRGHKFAVIRFSDRPAWTYDITTGAWTERATNVSDPWEIIGTTFAYNKWLGAVDVGEVYQFAGTNDHGSPLTRTAESRPLYLEGRKFVLSSVEVLAAVGISEGTQTAYESVTEEDGDIVTEDDGDVIYQEVTGPRDLQIMGQFSNNGGHSWSTEKWRSLGRVGDYEKRAIWNAQGQFTQCTMRHTLTEDADIPVYAEVNVTIT